MNSSTSPRRKSTLKVFMVEASPNWGQQFRLLCEAAWLQENGHKVVVLCGKSSRLAAELERNEPQVDTEKVDSWSIPRALQSGRDPACASYFHVIGIVIHSRHMTIPEAVPDGATLGYRCGAFHKKGFGRSFRSFGYAHRRGGGRRESRRVPS